MKPFNHINAETIDEAIAASSKKSKLIAGGTDCLGILKNKALASYPELLVNIKTIPGLSYIDDGDEGLKLGALTTLDGIAESPVVRKKYRLLADVAGAVASPQIRNMGTVGGNLCQDVRCWYYRCSPLTGRNYHCYRKGGRECFAPAGDNRYHAVIGGKACFAVCPSDIAVALTALDAAVKVEGPQKAKTVPVRKFYRPLGNILKANEIVTEIQVPKLPALKYKHSFLKFRSRKSIDFAVVSVAAIVAVEDGACQDVRVALGAVAPLPLRAAKVEEFLRGKAVDAAAAEAAAEAAVAGAAPLTMNAYKVEIAKALIQRALLT
jgi:xanthine dehydrogenase YagS FAD-binding subunit